MAATAHWTAAPDFPVHGSPRDKLGSAVKLATLVPAAAPRQPCQFQLSDRFVELTPLASPQDEGLDPAEREAMIECGTRLEYLKLALKRQGGLGRVDLFPDLDRPTLAARVHAGNSGARDLHEQKLFDAMTAGASNPRRLELPISDATLDCLHHGMTGERAWLEFARSENSRQRLLDLTQASGRLQLKEIRLQSETLIRSSHGAWEAAGFTGTTLHERFSRWRKPAIAFRVRPASEPTPASQTFAEPVSSHAVLAVLKTKTDDKHGWLGAGQMLARLLLQARTLNLACTPFLDVLQRPELRAALRTTIGHKGFTQVILQFAGTPTTSHLPSDPNFPATTTASSVG